MGRLVSGQDGIERYLVALSLFVGLPLRFNDGVHDLGM
jgi:hypothetical protein